MKSPKIVHRYTDELKPFARNARTHSKKQIKQIADSIRRFGFTNPVIIDEAGVIMAGHGRVEAAKLLGMTEIPCVLIGKMSESEKRAYILADNKLALNAGWDDEILAIELQFLVSQAPEIDVTITGFEIAEIDSLIDVGVNPADADPADDNIPEPSSANPVTETGDVWQLGPHRLLCRDARDVNAYKQLLWVDGSLPELAQMVFTDPPFNVRIDGHAGGSGRIHHREFAMASGEMSRAQFARFLSDVFEQLKAHSIDGSIHYICMDWRHMAEMQEAGENTFAELKNLIVWVKDAGGMGTFYRSRHELIYVWKNGSAEHINTFELGQKGRYRTNVWQYRGVNSGGAAAREALLMHPTTKPVAMVCDAMLDCSQRGGIVLDPFCGSGTTLIAAQRIGRRARTMELDPHYCDVAVKRWQNYAKDDAILARTGETFSEVLKRKSDGPAAGNNATIAASSPAETTTTSDKMESSPWSRYPSP
ncbi:MAG: site-specific DNA-methyltransferase [Rhizobiaceae bacterium]|nr:site-specific DNA-methyltransferase [Rhizobiaceae bacterium]